MIDYKILSIRCTEKQRFLLAGYKYATIHGLNENVRHLKLSMKIFFIELVRKKLKLSDGNPRLSDLHTSSSMHGRQCVC